MSALKSVTNRRYGMARAMRAASISHSPLRFTIM
jgi:hypothetical protein